MVLPIPKFAFAGAVLLGFALAGGIAQAQTAPTTDFLSILPEIPLPAGFVEYSEEGLVFDKAEGRIADAVASGSATPEAVKEFYAETLPSLGWQVFGDSAWQRGAERLTLQILGGQILGDETSGEVQIRFLLRPHGE